AGLSPFAPGTCGSAVTTVIFLIVALLTGHSVAVAVVLVFLALYGGAATILCGDKVMETHGHDPGLIVSDEVCGQAITYFWFLPMFSFSSPQEIIAFGVLGFLLFRAFDIIKPWPASYFDRQQSTWGVLLDDVAAGVQANIVLQIVWRLGCLECVLGTF
ncbi:MAG: phosphatidylglycerophosphatase A, partial [Phycisphaerae bacterium]|nr:phosphatidylglycerophosphatase A [Phycisphaerae bacterium]